MEQTSTPAPLGSWIVALTFVGLLALAVLAHALLAGSPPSPRFDNFNGDRLAAIRERRDSNQRALVVLLGTSALKYATDEDKDFARQVAFLLGYPVDVLRVVNNFGVYGDFDNLAHAILELKPDLVLLQEELLVTDRPWWRHFLRDLNHLKWLLTGEGGFDDPGVTAQDVQFDLPCWRRSGVFEIDAQLENREKWVTVNPDGPDARASRKFVAAARAEQIPVVLLDVPRRPDLEQYGNARRREALASSAIADTVRLVQTWKPPRIGAEHYCDIAHVTALGRRMYTSWLENRVATALAESRAR